VRTSGPGTFGVLFSVATLLWGFAQAPFFHIHAEDLDHEQNSGLEHVHVRSIPLSPGPQIGPYTADDDAIDVIWSISAPSVVQFHFVLEIADHPVIDAPVMAGSLVASVSLHSHDPPAFRPNNPRAPPA
jgi:hypothetical protein